MEGNVRALALQTLISQLGFGMFYVIWQPLILSAGAPDPHLPEHQDPRSLLSALIRFLVETHRRNRAILSSMQVVFLSHPESYRRDAEAISAGDSDFSVIEAVVERTGIKDPNVRRDAARHIFHLLDAMIHRQVLEANITPDDEDLVALLTEMALAYLESLEKRN